MLALVLLGLVPAPSAVCAESPTLLPQALGVTEMYAARQRSGLGLDGFDPVSYRLASAPQEGSQAYEYVWHGLVWRFVSEANRAAFMRDPEVYAPRIGGYDAERIAHDIVVAADPEIYVVRPDGLYLFRNAEHRRRFLADQALAKEAERAWAHTRPGLVQG